MSEMKRSKELEFVEEFLLASGEKRWEMVVMADIDFTLVSRLIPNYDFDEVILEYQNGLKSKLEEVINPSILDFHGARATICKFWPLFNVNLSMPTYFDLPSLEFSINENVLCVRQSSMIDFNKFGQMLNHHNATGTRSVDKIAVNHEKILKGYVGALESIKLIKKGSLIKANSSLSKLNDILFELNRERIFFNLLSLKFNQSKILQELHSHCNEIRQLYNKSQLELDEAMNKNVITSIETYNSVVRDNVSRVFKVVNDYHVGIGVPKLELDFDGVTVSLDEFKLYGDKHYVPSNQRELANHLEGLLS